MRLFAGGALLLVATIGSSDPAAPAARPATTTAEFPRPVPRALPASAPTPEQPDLSIPGGGRILIPSGGVQVVDADGTVKWLDNPHPRVIDAVWDPLHPDALLVTGANDKGPNLHAYRPTHAGWGEARSWNVDLFYELSPDGRLIAHSVFVKSRLTGIVRVVNRRGDALWELRTEDLYPVSWTPNGAVLLSDRDDVGLFAWNMRAGTLTTLLLDSDLTAALPAGARSPWLDAQFMSWSGDGRYFAARVSWNMGGKQHRYGIAIGSPSGEILDVVPTGKKHPSIPTWSPAGSELAFVDSSSLDSKAKLQVYDVVSRRRTVLLRHSPHPWWVAWSPRGDWLLLDTQGPWLFVSREDGRVIERPRLGAFPRWASPGADIPVPKC